MSTTRRNTAEQSEGAHRPRGQRQHSGQLRRSADEQAVLSQSKGMPADAFRAWMNRHAFTLDRATKALGLSRRVIAYYLNGEPPVTKTVMLATEWYDARREA